MVLQKRSRLLDILKCKKNSYKQNNNKGKKLARGVG